MVFRNIYIYIYIYICIYIFRQKTFLAPCIESRGDWMHNSELSWHLSSTSDIPRVLNMCLIFFNTYLCFNLCVLDYTYIYVYGYPPPKGHNCFSTIYRNSSHLARVFYTLSLIWYIDNTILHYLTLWPNNEIWQ